VFENLTVYARLYGVRASGRRIRELARDLDLEEFLKRPTGSLSAGQRTRVALAKALLNRPSPAAARRADRLARPDTGDTVRSYLERYRATSGATIVLASRTWPRSSASATTY
jgi:ABC-2 type transport system ATP-binding protein